LLSRGINSLGKLDACTTDIKVNAGPWLKTIAEKPVDSQQICILLMSDARLFSDQNLDLKGANGGERLQEEYAKSWSLLSSGLLQLDSFYATQKLVGGEYYRRRFRQHEQPYNPWLVTCAGSVFYFQTKDVDASAKLLETWKESGLVVLPGVSEEWSKNPMVPANGYGEILTNPVIETLAIQEALNHG